MTSNQSSTNKEDRIINNGKIETASKHTLTHDNRTKNPNSKAKSNLDILHKLCSQEITSLFTIPILTLILVASLDTADKQLLSSSFPALERTLHLDVQTLGTFSLFSNLSYALGMPLWGWAVHHYGLHNVHNLLGIACASWGLSTLGIACFGSSITMQASFRALNGVSLASMLPLSQTVLVELVKPSMRGRAFGLMTVFEKLAGTLATTSAVYFEDAWQRPYYALCAFSWTMALVARDRLRMERKQRKAATRQRFQPLPPPPPSKDENRRMTYRQIVQRIASLPEFLCLVAQGVCGGTPWDMMSFLLLLFDWRGYTKSQIVTLQVSVGATGTIGSYLGGYLGDRFSRFKQGRGRIYVALFGVCTHIPTYGMFLYCGSSYKWALLWYNAFHLFGTWTPAAAIRPMCAELARDPSERAQIVSMWVLLEKVSGSLFGAPLVGYFTQRMIKDGDKRNDGLTSNKNKAEDLAFSLFTLSAFFWVLCALFWYIMTRVVSGNKLRKKDDDVAVKEQEELKEAEYSAKGKDEEMAMLIKL